MFVYSQNAFDPTLQNNKAYADNLLQYTNAPTEEQSSCECVEVGTHES